MLCYATDISFMVALHPDVHLASYIACREVIKMKLPH